jgi:hypothetical protein
MIPPIQPLETLKRKKYFLFLVFQKPGMVVSLRLSKNTETIN